MKLAVVLLVMTAGIALAQYSGLPSLGGGSSSSASSFWYDAGAGYIYANETLKNPDGGALYIRADRPADHSNMTDGLVLGHTTTPEGSNLSPMFSLVGGIVSPPSGSRLGAMFGSASTSGSVKAGLMLWGGGNITFQGGSVGATPGRTATLLGFWSVGTGTLTFSQASGNDAFLFTTGARAHLGGGTNDYFVSDGTGTETPGYVEVGDYVEGTTGFCSGAACLGTAFASFPAATGAQASRLRYDSTNSVWRASNGTDWSPQSRLQFSGYCRGPVTEECTDAQIFGVAKSEVGKNYAGNITCGWTTAGTGGTKVVVRVLSDGDVSTDCRCDLGACTGSGGTCTCNKFLAAGTVFMQNLQVALDGGTFGDCTTHPGGIYCTVD